MNQKAHTEALGSLSIGRLLARLAIPTSVALLVTSTYNLVDAVFVGRGVGPEAIGALTVIHPFQILVMAFGNLIAIGAASIVSRSLGAGDAARASRAAGNAFAFAVATGLTIAIGGTVFLRPLVGALGASGRLVEPAARYFAIILFVEPLLLTNLTANSLIRAEGQARVAMMTMIVGMLVNIALDPLFIFVFNWGVRGAALATLIGRLTTTVLVVRYFASGRSSLRIRFADFQPDRGILREITSVGTSGFVRQAGTSFAAALRNNLLVAYGGTMFLSAFGAVFRIILFLGMPGMGIAQAVQPMAGYNYGAGNMDRVRKSVWIAIGVCTLFMTVGFVVIQLFPGPLLRLFSSDREMVEEGISIVRISAYLFLTFPAYIIGPSFYQAIGKPRSALLLSLARPVVGAAAMLLGVRILGVMGVVIADPLAVTAAALFAVFYLRASLGSLGDGKPAATAHSQAKSGGQVRAAAPGGSASRRPAAKS